MFYIVYTPSHYIEKSYKTEKAAKSAWTRKWSKKPDADKLTIMSRERYNELDIEVPVKNLLSGKTVYIRRSEKGGCCDPSTERYHCM